MLPGNISATYNLRFRATSSSSLAVVKMLVRPRFTPRLVLLVGALAAAPGCDRADDAAEAAVSLVSADRVAAQQHWEAARKLAAEGDYQSAVAQYTVALDAMRAEPQTLDLDKPDADVLFQRGVAYLELDFPDTAAADFTEVLRMRPDHGAAFVKRGEAHLRLHDYYNGARDCTDGIRYGGPAADAHRFRGEAYLARRQFDRAAADLESAVEFEPGRAEELRPMLAAAYRGWGQELAAAGADEEAAAKIARADEFAPAGTAPAEELFGNPDERSAAKPVIDDARERYEQGVQCYNEGRYEEALTWLTEAIDLRSDYTEAYIARAKTLMVKGFSDTAVMDLDQALRYGGDAVEPLWLKAQAFMQLENPNRAVLAATDALHLDPTVADCYAVRGKAYVALANWERAVLDLDEAVRRDATLAAELSPYLDRARRLRDASSARNVEAEPEFSGQDPTVNRPSA
jgi:tetratricopeptide (TPR) repeat protein